MSKRKPTKLEKSTKIISNSKASQWCYVNIHNEFTFMNQSFVIHQSVKDYEVVRKAGEFDDYTNEASMEEILVAIGNDDKLCFFNQNYDAIENKFISVRE